MTGSNLEAIRKAVWRAASPVASRISAIAPESIDIRINPKKYGFSPADVPHPITPPRAPRRLLIAPVNFAGQGNRWARAAELLPGVAARNMSYSSTGAFKFESDYQVPVEVFVRSLRWQKRQFRAVRDGFSHVLIEAERPIFGRLFNESVIDEVTALQASGVKVGMVIHGTDARLPSAHQAREPWSPYARMADVEREQLESLAVANRDVLRNAGVPVFASTTGSLLDWPDATWLPVVVEVEKWNRGREPLTRERPRVVHAPSSSIIKGSDLIEPIARELDANGLIEYRQISGVPASEMPNLYAGADIVLDSFLTGHYGVATCEALAAGRVVVSHVHNFGRRYLRNTFDAELPVVQATPDTLRATLLSVLADRDRFVRLARRGPDFVRRVHNGRESAAALGPFLGSKHQ